MSPVFLNAEKSNPEIKYPLSTKNRSTPAHPWFTIDRSHPLGLWKITVCAASTIMMATARNTANWRLRIFIAPILAWTVLVS